MNPVRTLALLTAAWLLLGCLASSSAGATGSDPFSLDDAYRETLSPVRERISLNGQWRFQPAQDIAIPPPATLCCTLRVPGRWNAEDVAYGGFVVRDAAGSPLTDWHGASLGDVAAAWYQRDLTVPAAWAGRRIILRVDHIGAGVDERVGDYAAGAAKDETLRKDASVWVNGQRAQVEDDWRADITALVHSGAPNVLAIGVRSRSRAQRWGRGINGDVWLECQPETHIARYDWSTSFADRALALTAIVRNAGRAPANLRLRATLAGAAIGESPVSPVAAAGEATLALRAAVPSLPAWSEFDPRLTPLRLDLLDGNTVVDTVIARVAMRDWRIAGDAIVMNGRRIALRTESGPTLGIGMEIFDRSFVRALFAAYRDAHYNSIRSLWGRAPDYVYDLTDELGLMVEQILPSPAMFRTRTGIRDDAQFWPAYEAALAAEIAPTRDHVSVVAYDLWAHEGGDRLQNQPDHVDGVWKPLPLDRERARAEILRAVDILHRLDPSRDVLLDEAGNLGKAVDVHPYFDFSVPLQEWEDWPERRAGHAVKPLVASEFGLPYVGAWHEWDPLRWDLTDGHSMVIENAARYLGDAAYVLSKSSMLDHDWKERGEGYIPESAIDPGLTTSERGVSRYRPNAAGEAVAAMFATRVYRAWRAARVHIGPFAQDTMTGATMLFQPVDATFQPPAASLKTPGPKPDRVVRSARFYQLTTLPVPTPAQDPAEVRTQTTAVYAATRAAFAPLLVYLGGGGEGGPTGKDHAFAAGEAIQKSVVMVNDGPSDARIVAHWALVGGRDAKPVQQGTVAMTAPQGRTTTAQIALGAPTVTARTAYRLVLSAASDGREIAKDEFDLQVFPRQPPPLALPKGLRIGLYDTRGGTARALDAMGVAYRRIDRLTPDLDHDLDVLVVGAMSLDLSARQLAPAIERGLRVLAFEQAVGAVTNLAASTGAIFDTTDMAATAARIVFPTDPAHPILAGLQAEDLADWRGTSDLLPAYAPASETSYLYRPGGAEKFRGSNRGIVASRVLPKPQRGNFRVILSSGFDLRQTPLVEFMLGRGRLVLMQLDVTARYGRDPVATRLMRNAIAYMAGAEAAHRPAGYIGEAHGKIVLQSLGAVCADVGDGLAAKLDQLGVILAGEGAERVLRNNEAAVLGWIKGGGRLIVFDDVLTRLGPEWFPGRGIADRTQLFKGQFPPGEALLRGLGQSDAYFRQGLSFAHVETREGGGELSPVQIFHVGAGAIVTLPLPSTAPLPVLAKGAEARVTPSADKASRIVATVLTNAGVALATPLSLFPEIIDLTGEWRFRTDPSDTGKDAGWGRADFDDSAWRTIRVPGLWAFQNVPGPPSRGGVGYDGVAWYRRTVTIPAEWKADPAPVVLVIQGLADTGDVYWNGKPIAHGQDRSYFRDKVELPIEPSLVPYGGKVTIAARVVDKGPAGGLAGAIGIRKADVWPLPHVPVGYGETHPDFEPDSYRYW